MGIRLYPNTGCVATLETLAGVPAGTKKKLLELIEFHRGDNDNGRKFVDALWDDPNNKHLLEFDMFETWGWGRVNIPENLIENEVDDKNGGVIKNVEAVKCLLKMKEVTLPEGIEIEDLRGVCWC